MIGIYTIAYNQPQYLPYQAKLLAKYLLDTPYVFHVVDNVSNSDGPNLHNANLNHKQAIRNLAEEHGITYHENPYSDSRTANDSHACALQYTYNGLVKDSNDTYSIICDHDMFLVEPFSVAEYMQGVDIAGTPQSREHIKYYHPAIMMFSKDMPYKDNVTLGCGVVDGVNVDVGGLLYHYLVQNPSVRTKDIFCEDICTSNENLSIFPEHVRSTYDDMYPHWLVAKSFYHIRLGSNWTNLESDVFSNRLNTGIAFLEYKLS